MSFCKSVVPGRPCEGPGANEAEPKDQTPAMNIQTARSVSNFTSQAVEHFDVLIVGAGISGIGSAYHLTTQLPGTSFVILETQESFGGTWITHKYPGIRSDSDLHTFGYRFKPGSVRRLRPPTKSSPTWAR